MTCNCCQVTDQAFGDKDAKDDLRDYQRHGPARQTRAILSAVRSLGLKDATLLDIGGGVGTIHHELLEDTVRTVTHVDASSAYLRQAEAEAARLGHTGRVKFVHADFTDVAADLPAAEIVTSRSRRLLLSRRCEIARRRGWSEPTGARHDLPARVLVYAAGIESGERLSAPSPRSISGVLASCWADGSALAGGGTAQGGVETDVCLGDGIVLPRTVTCHA